MLNQRQRRPDPMPTIQSAVLPAPIGGLNTISPGADMPPTDAVLLYNMVAAEYGLRIRLGYREWCTGLTDTTTSSAAAEVRSILPFTGSDKAGANSRLFATTNTGIWDVTSSSQAPTKVLTFAAPDVTYAGWGNCCVFVNYAGKHFLLYCDEANGFHVYTETSGTWTAVAQASSNPWLQGVQYGIGDLVSNAGASYVCSTAGISDLAGLGPSGNGTNLPDGTCAWDFYPSIGGADPTTFCQVNVWANRVWFTERDTGQAWYTGIGALFGTVAKLVFGSRFKAGGDLRGLFNWTTDGGSGLTTSLVAISGGGDVVIYQGTDPTQASMFQLKGVWSLGGGGVPWGRRIATDFGGDLLLLSSIGVMPLSRLVMGQSSADQSQYATAKIGNLFAKYAQAGRGFPGWQIRIHPNDNTLLINSPQVDGSTQQMAMSLITKGWSIYRDMPTSFSSEAFDGEFYMGTTDGRVLLNTDFQDGVLLADPNASIPVQWEVLTAFQSLGSPKRKRIHTIRPHFLSNGGNVEFAAAARFDYDFTELYSVGQGAAASNAWGTAKWGDPWTANTGYRVQATTAWTPNTSYLPGNTVTNESGSFICTFGGTSGAAGEGPTGGGIGQTDGTCTWAAYTYQVTANNGIWVCSQAGTSAASGAGPSGTTSGVVDGTVRWNYSGAYSPATFGSEYSPEQRPRGATGCGSAMAVILRGAATSKTMLVGIDVLFDVGSYF